jgi:hypothetical protein
MALEGGILTAANSELAVLIANNDIIAPKDISSLYKLTNKIFVIHNKQMAEMVSMLAEPVPFREMRYGGDTDAYEVHEVEEFGRTSAVKGESSSKVGFPFRRYARSLGWTADFWTKTTYRQFDNQITKLLNSDRVLLMKLIRNALFRATNYNFVDRLADGQTVGVKALVNADSAPIPAGPNAEEFNAASHTHYVAVTSLTAAAVRAHLQNVTEHYSGGNVVMFINQADAGSYVGLSGFVAALPSDVNPASTISTTKFGNTSVFPDARRLIGSFDGVPIYSVWWVPATYNLCINSGSGIQAPLGFRVGPGYDKQEMYNSIIAGGGSAKAGPGDLQIVSETLEFPWYAKEWQRQIGFGVLGRTSAAILQVGADTTYDVPTF